MFHFPASHNPLWANALNHIAVGCPISLLDACRAHHRSTTLRHKRQRAAIPRCRFLSHSHRRKSPPWLSPNVRMQSCSRAVSRHSTDARRDASNCAKETGLGRLDVIRMNIERCPIANAAILLRGNGENSYSRVLVQNKVADFGALPRLVKCNDNQVWLRLAYATRDVLVI